MNEYEVLYITQSEMSEDALKDLKAKIDSIISKEAGQTLLHADWGKRKFAYRIKKQRRGQYIYLRFIAPGSAITELERNLRIQDQVLKFISVKISDAVNPDERKEAQIELPPLAPEFSAEHA